MKNEEKIKARRLRSLGHSMNEIKTLLGVSKSSISLWVRDILLTQKQKQTLSKKGVRREVIERRRQTRLNNESAKRQIIIDAAYQEIDRITKRELWLIGVLLYWAEGGKTMRNVVRFSNSDPNMIQCMMYFFRKICGVPEEKFRIHIHIHPHLDYRKAERYWSAISGIPLKQFYKTYRKSSIASKGKRETLPHGTCDVYVCNTKLFLKICGWAKGIFQHINNLKDARL